jgi:hypothetical protein
MGVKRNLEVGEVIIECIINGSGQTVILLPRLGGDADQIEELARALADAGFAPWASIQSDLANGNPIFLAV